MALFLSLFPIYLLGNFHCLGMCGPLVSLLARHPLKWLYFVGRIFSFSLAGLFAGEMGVVIDVLFKKFHLSAISAFLFGMIFFAMACSYFFTFAIPGKNILLKNIAPLSKKFALLLDKENPWGTFAFGFFTVIFPCGQTFIVFSACALFGSAFHGMLNGFCFALLTSPSLVFAMKSFSFLSKKIQFEKLNGILSIFLGFLAILRGLAELSWIPHLILNSHSSNFHIALF